MTVRLKEQVSILGLVQIVRTWWKVFHVRTGGAPDIPTGLAHKDVSEVIGGTGEA